MTPPGLVIAPASVITIVVFRIALDYPVIDHIDKDSEGKLVDSYVPQH
jgi:hypothetical protein